MTRAILQKPAETDLYEIWAYSSENWGADQADRYIDAIEEAIDLLAIEPMRGRACDELRPGYRRRITGSHIIFYTVSERGISVARILHARMDYDGQL